MPTKPQSCKTAKSNKKQSTRHQIGAFLLPLTLPYHCCTITLQHKRPLNRVAFLHQQTYRNKKKRVTHPLLSCCFISLLQAVLFLELVNTSACIYKFLLTCKVGVTLVADFNLDCVCVFGCTCYKCCATSTYNSRFMIIWMYTLFHIAPRPLYLELCSTAFLFYYNKTNPSSILCKFALATFWGHFVLSVMLTHATSPKVRGLIMMRTLNTGGSKPPPYNEIVLI